jgi:hypothetical protein
MSKSKHEKIEDGVPVSLYAAKVKILADQIFWHASHETNQDAAFALNAVLDVLARLLMVLSPADPVAHFRTQVPAIEDWLAKTVAHYEGGPAPSRNRGMN